MAALAAGGVMGILNITPDSFYDGGHYIQLPDAIEQAHKLLSAGADIIDVGGESTRPGAESITAQQQGERVLPVIHSLYQHSGIPISIDTQDPDVMQAALKAGASIINDVNALQAPGALEVARKAQIVCLMHKQGVPTTMQEAPSYENVVAQVYDFLKERIKACEEAGIHKEKIWIDPGFGFGKTLEHNLQLLANLKHFKQLGCPILVGLSRKSWLQKLLNLPLEERLIGSVSAQLLAFLQGADWFRTHDVSQTKQALLVAKAVMSYTANTKESWVEYEGS